jgi:hypothetical protein
MTPMRRTSHARRAVLCGLAIFFAGQLLLAALDEATGGRLRDPLHAGRVRRLREKSAAAPEAPVVLLLGTSRVALGVRSELLEQELSSAAGGPVIVANWSTGGWGPFLSLLSWDRFRREGLRADLVVLEVLPPLLNANCQTAHVANELSPPRS